MAAAQNQRYCRLFHTRNHFRDSQSRFNVTANCVEKQKQTVNVITLLNAGKQRQNMLVFCGLTVFREHLMTLHLADDGQCIDVAFFSFCDIRAKLNDLFPFLLFCVGI